MQIYLFMFPKIYSCRKHKNIFTFSIMSQHWDGTGMWNPSSWRARSQASCNTQYHGCWWPGDARSLGIISHGIDLICLEYLGFNAIRNYLYECRRQTSVILLSKMCWCQSHYVPRWNSADCELVHIYWCIYINTYMCVYPQGLKGLFYTGSYVYVYVPPGP